MYSKLFKTALLTTSLAVAVGAQAAKTLDVSDAQKDMRYPIDGAGFALQKVRQALRQRYHPLAQRQPRKDMVH